jgi:hypothetical protein
MDPMLDYLIELAVTAVFTTLGSWSPGRAARWPGTIVINPAESWSEWDVVEAYVRELTRTLLWLDEHRYGHRLDRPDPRMGAVVASFHDVVVAAEVLTLRDELLPADLPPPFRGPPEAVARPALDAAGAILRKPQAERVLAPRARQLTELAAERIKDTFGPRALSQAG